MIKEIICFFTGHKIVWKENNFSDEFKKTYSGQWKFGKCERCRKRFSFDPGPDAGYGKHKGGVYV